MNKRWTSMLAWLMVTVFALAVPALAAKGGGGNQGDGAQSGWSDKADMSKGQEKGDGNRDRLEKSRQDRSDDASGLSKQREKKLEQERKEAGQGSETGQEKRAEHSRKWWRFWE